MRYHAITSGNGLSSGDGLPDSLTDSTLTLNRSFSGYGGLTNQAVNVNSNDLFAYDLIYNDNNHDSEIGLIRASLNKACFFINKAYSCTKSIQACPYW